MGGGLVPGFHSRQAEAEVAAATSEVSQIVQQLHAGHHTWKLQQGADVGLLKRLGGPATQGGCIMVATLDGATAVHLQNGL